MFDNSISNGKTGLFYWTFSMSLNLTSKLLFVCSKWPSIHMTVMWNSSFPSSRPCCQVVYCFVTYGILDDIIHFLTLSAVSRSYGLLHHCNVLLQKWLHSSSGKRMSVYNFWLHIVLEFFIIKNAMSILHHLLPGLLWLGKTLWTTGSNQQLKWRVEKRKLIPTYLRRLRKRLGLYTVDQIPPPPFSKVALTLQKS